MGSILGAIIGAVIAGLSGLGLWKIVEIIIQGAEKGNWLMVIAGGILAWVFGFILFVICLAGIALLIISITD